MKVENEMRDEWIEELAVKLERIAERAERKEEAPAFTTNRVEANRLYAMWLRTQKGGGA